MPCQTAGRTRTRPRVCRPESDRFARL